MKILALDLGKYKTAEVILERKRPSTRCHASATVFDFAYLILNLSAIKNIDDRRTRLARK